MTTASVSHVSTPSLTPSTVQLGGSIACIHGIGGARAEEGGVMPAWESGVLAETGWVIKGLAHVATEGATETGWAVYGD